jgi:hypothetical protein
MPTRVVKLQSNRFVWLIIIKSNTLLSIFCVVCRLPLLLLRLPARSPIPALRVHADTRVHVRPLSPPIATELEYQTNLVLLFHISL